jgi:DNA gyrase subunit A
VLVRTRVSEIRELGRATQGVTLMALDDGSKLSGLQRIVENDASIDATSEAGDAAEDSPTTPSIDPTDPAGNAGTENS